MPGEIKFEMSQTEVCALGFSAAGWDALIEVEGTKVVEHPLPKEDSYYQSTHVMPMMNTATKDFYRLAIAKEVLENLAIGLSYEDQNKLIDMYNFLIQVPTKEPLSSLQKVSLASLKEGETLTQMLQKANIRPYDFVKLIVSIDDFYQSQLPPLFSINVENQNTFKEHQETFKSIMEKMKFFCFEQRIYNIQTDDYRGVRTTVWGSKAIIADTFQENLRRFYAGEPLIPIKITVATEKADSKFTFNSKNVKDKADAFFTSAEIRMIYKLMYELNDDVAKQIMQNTVIFLKENSEGDFEKIENMPFENWLDRPRGERGEHKAPYHERAALPVWIKKILENGGKGPSKLPYSASEEHVKQAQKVENHEENQEDPEYPQETFREGTMPSFKGSPSESEDNPEEISSEGITPSSEGIPPGSEENPDDLTIHMPTFSEETEETNPSFKRIPLESKERSSERITPSANNISQEAEDNPEEIPAVGMTPSSKEITPSEEQLTALLATIANGRLLKAGTTGFYIECPTQEITRSIVSGFKEQGYHVQSPNNLFESSQFKIENNNRITVYGTSLVSHISLLVSKHPELLPPEPGNELGQCVVQSS